MSEYVIPSARVYEPPREPRDRLHRVILPALALMALLGPMLLVGAYIVWALFQSSEVAEPISVQLDVPSALRTLA